MCEVRGPDLGEKLCKFCVAFVCTILARSDRFQKCDPVLPPSILERVVLVSLSINKEVVDLHQRWQSAT